VIFEFEVISDVVKRPGRGPLFTWPDEVFDGQQRLVTPLQVKEMGYAALASAQGSFRKAAEKRGLRAVCVMVDPGRKYANGGLAIRAIVPAGLKLKECPCPEHDGPRLLVSNQFNKNQAQSDGLSAWCRDCQHRSNRRRDRQRRADKRQGPVMLAGAGPGSRTEALADPGIQGDQQPGSAEGEPDSSAVVRLLGTIKLGRQAIQQSRSYATRDDMLAGWLRLAASGETSLTEAQVTQIFDQAWPCPAEAS
jgi:hypothetical protein